MRRKSPVFGITLSVLLLTAAISYAQPNVHQNPATISCDSTLAANLLNSERIEKKFGGYGINVLYNSSRLRVSNLYDGKKITRTLAVVDYPQTIDSSFSKEHEIIIQGGSIGSVFKAHGWTIEKKSIFLGELPPSHNYRRLYELMGNIAPSTLSIWIYVFYIRKGGKVYPYATISEIYHPAYLSLADLKCINQNGDAYLQRTEEVNNELKKVTKLMKLKFNKT